MIYEGVEHLPGKDGKFRCPWACGNPNFPQPSWITDKGFEKHLSKCKAKPEKELVYTRPAGKAFEYFGDCEDCGATIFHMEEIWWLPKRLVCLECYRPYFEVGRGHREPAGLEIPYIALEG